jgi:hypothetical protein
MDRSALMQTPQIPIPFLSIPRFDGIASRAETDHSRCHQKLHREALSLLIHAPTLIVGACGASLGNWLIARSVRPQKPPTQRWRTMLCRSRAEMGWVLGAPNGTRNRSADNPLPGVVRSTNRLPKSARTLINVGLGGSPPVNDVVNVQLVISIWPTLDCRLVSFSHLNVRKYELLSPQSRK